jgi:hypothetical protein
MQLVVELQRRYVLAEIAFLVTCFRSDSVNATNVRERRPLTGLR